MTSTQAVTVYDKISGYLRGGVLALCAATLAAGTLSVATNSHPADRQPGAGHVANGVWPTPPAPDPDTD